MHMYSVAKSKVICIRIVCVGKDPGNKAYKSMAAWQHTCGNALYITVLLSIFTFYLQSKL